MHESVDMETQGPVVVGGGGMSASARGCHSLRLTDHP